MSVARPSSKFRNPFIGKGEQILLAVMWAVSLSTIGIYLFWHGVYRGELIEIEEAPSRKMVFQVDVNMAAWPEFSMLPKVSETLARRIVKDREENGNFRHHGELTRVSGIGPKTLERIKPFLRPVRETTASR